MALARVVSFEDVNKDRIEEFKREITEGPPPEGLPATEILVLHDADAEKSLMVVFFDTEDDYAQGDATLNAMPTGDTPGQRTSVTKYDVAVRMTVLTAGPARPQRVQAAENRPLWRLRARHRNRSEASRMRPPPPSAALC